MANELIEMNGGKEELSRVSPNGRVGEAEDVAAAVVFLSSRAGGHINGDTLVLDGGNMLASARL